VFASMTKKPSQSEQFRDDIVRLMKDNATVSMPFADVLHRLREAYKRPLRADNLKNAIMTQASPLALIDQGKTVILMDVTLSLGEIDLDD
jgi:hypothetical protein